MSAYSHYDLSLNGAAEEQNKIDAIHAQFLAMKALLLTYNGNFEVVEADDACQNLANILDDAWGETFLPLKAEITDVYSRLENEHEGRAA